MIRNYKILLLAAFLIGCGIRDSWGQSYLWTQKANYTPTERYGEGGFVIGNTGYFGCGFTSVGTNDFWAYDPVTDTWTQKANFGGSPRGYVTGFSIGSVGYLGGGYSLTSGYVNDFWRYDPSTNSWIQIPNFPTSQVSEASGFSDGTLGYVTGTGTHTVYTYNPTSNSWSTVASIPGASDRTSSSAFVINNVVYAGLGYTNSPVYNTPLEDMYKYNDTTNAWTAIASMTDGGRSLAAAWTINGQGVISGGDQGNSRISTSYMYNPAADSWTQLSTGKYFEDDLALSLNGGGYQFGSLGSNNVFDLHPCWNDSSTTNLSICSSALPYHWNSAVFSAAGSQTVHLTNAGGCDSAATLNLTVRQVSTSSTSLSICSSALPYHWNGLTFSAAGSQTAHLTNAAGCDSAATLHLTVNPTSTSSTSRSICSNALPYSWNGLTFTASGSQTAHLTNHIGCDSAATLNLTVNSVTYSNVNQTICQGSTFLGRSVTGVYTDTLTGSRGCDSIRTLYLTVNPLSYSTITQSICQGSTYLGRSVTGVYRDTLIGINGCDSVRTLNLTVNPNLTTTITQSICQGGSYAGYTSSGTYTDHFTSAAGCDSARTLYLTVIPNVTGTVSLSICQGGSYAGYTSSGTYTDHFTSASGCDSARTLYLTVIPNVTSTVTQSICPGGNYAGHISTGTYTDHYTSAAGCDSARTLYLTVTPLSLSSVSQSICQGTGIVFGGRTLTSAGSYADTLTGAAASGCDSVITLHLTIKANPTHTITTTIASGQIYTVGPDTFTATGTYTVRLTGAAANGCDSIVTLNLTVPGSTNACVPTVSIGANSTSPCTPVTFTATPSNGGTSPNYQWYRNNIPEGTNSLSYTAASLNYQDSVWVEISTTTCGSPTVKTAISNKVKIIGADGSTTSVTISANTTNLNLGGTITFTATPVNAGTNPRYNWYHNGSLVASDHSSPMNYSGALGNGDQMYCTLTTTSCGATLTVTSDTLYFTRSGSSEKNITTLTMPDQIGTSVIDTVAGTVTAVVSLTPAQRTAIHPTRLYVSTGAAYGPSYANNQNFSLPVTYTVTAQDGSSRVWTVTVVDAAGQRLTADGGGQSDPVIVGLTLYPNPASTYITALMQGGTEPAVVTILDLTGRVMYNQQLPPSETINHQIDVSEYAAGNYIVNVTAGNRSETKKFTVVRQ